MGVGVIVVVEGNTGLRANRGSRLHAVETGPGQESGGWAELSEVFGQSVLERVLHKLSCAPVEATTLLIREDWLSRIPPLQGPMPNLYVQAADDVWAEVAVTLKEYSESGISYAFISRPNAYIEADLADLLEFHRGGRTAVTRAKDGEGPLDLWAVDCDATWQSGFSNNDGGNEPRVLTGSYFVKDYARRVRDCRDLRQIVVDTFAARCKMQPSGHEIRPGVWADDGIEICRGARVVAPAYLGRGSKVGENALVTRCSNVESSSYIDYGTAIEDSSVLANTYVGIGLDVRHAVVQGNELMNLERNVKLEISDPSLFRRIVADGRAMEGKSAVRTLLENSPARPGKREKEQDHVVKNIRSVNATTELES